MSDKKVSVWREAMIGSALLTLTVAGFAVRDKRPDDTPREETEKPIIAEYSKIIEIDRSRVYKWDEIQAVVEQVNNQLRGEKAKVIFKR